MLEDHQKFAEKVESFLKYCRFKNIQLTTSVITFLEFGVKPYGENRIDLIEGFKDFIQEANINISEITLRDCDIASQLRGKYKGLKTFDALQVSIC